MKIHYYFTYEKKKKIKFSKTGKFQFMGASIGKPRAMRKIAKTGWGSQLAGKLDSED